MLETIPELQPALYLVAGLVVLVFPKVLNYLVAAYLIFLGAIGLWPNLL